MGINLDPQATASPIYNIWYSNDMVLATPDSIPEAVIMATVAEPCAVRTTAAIKKCQWN